MAAVTITMLNPLHCLAALLLLLPASHAWCTTAGGVGEHSKACVTRIQKKMHSHGSWR